MFFFFCIRPSTKIPEKRKDAAIIIPQSKPVEEVEEEKPLIKEKHPVICRVTKKSDRDAFKMYDLMLFIQLLTYVNEYM